MSQPAELIWARYDKDSGSKHYLLVYVGEHDNKTVALIADLIPDSEIKILRQNLGEIRTKDLLSISKFLKDKMPMSYSKAYKHFNTRKLTILRNLGLTAIKTQQEHKEDRKNQLSKS